MSISDVIQLSKVRLTSSVVFSAIAGYFIAGGSYDSLHLFYLIVGGFLVVASSNGFNQLIEIDLDSMMKRTENRPLPTKRMNPKEALLISLLMGLIGVSLLFLINFRSGFLGAFSVFLYVLAYTPLKRISSISVFVGAFPGAFPFMLGWVAVTNSYDIEALILFSIQFIWQFPHFWAIAWVSSEDYQRAGFKMLPGPKDRSTAFKALIYTIFLIPISILPVFGIAGKLQLSLVAALLAVVAGLWFLTKAVKLFKTLDDADARRLMISSFIYLPILQLIYVIDKLL
ncbi:MAG: heme o synthase [Flavobacteriales bacterium]|jgi:protoheme IX farnesyltransferase|tara:strand:+ start:2793 stop:3647 length:855 start_codon:yes stop_codon:yes gene_type:complete